MRKLLFFSFIILTVAAWAKDDALNQAQSMTSENLANSTYYDQVHNSANSQNTSLKSHQGKFTTMRENAGYGFDTAADKKMSYHNGGSNRHVDGYVTNAEDGSIVIMESPTKNIPPVSKPVSVSAAETDDMFLDMLGESSADSYKGNYETAVGKKQEHDFDMSADLNAAVAKQNMANEQFANDVAAAKQRQAQQAAQQANNTAQKEPGFWSKIGKIALQGAVNVGIEATNYKYGTNIETIGNKQQSSGGNKNQTCSLEGVTFHGDTCTYCVYNKPRSSSDCNKCCYSFGRSLMQPPSYSAFSSGGRPSGCLCRFGPTSGYRF